VNRNRVEEESNMDRCIEIEEIINIGIFVLCKFFSNEKFLPSPNHLFSSLNQA
jgi:hypothetical protein